MKQLFIFILLTFTTTLLYADGGFVLKERKWVDIYSQPQVDVSGRILTFKEIDAARSNKNYSSIDGSEVVIQGYFERENLTAFRITEDFEPVPGRCHSCIEKLAFDSPRVSIPENIISKISKGLVRVYGTAKTFPDRLNKTSELQPIIEIQAKRVAVPEE